MALASAGLLLCTAASLARTPELPRELQGKVAIEIGRCSPVGRDDALLEARVRIRAGDAALELPGLHCAAYDDAGAAFFQTPVTGRIRLAAGGSEELTVRFAADGTHRECGCTVRVGPLQATPDGGIDAEFRALVAELSASDRDPRERPSSANAGADAAPLQAPGGEALELAAAPAAPEPPSSEARAAPLAPPALCYKRVLAPNLSLRAEPSMQAPRVGAAPPGARIAVDRALRGWKLARTADGLAGWLPSDASTADLMAPERMSERFERLHAALAAGDGLCDSVQRDSLGDLVAIFRLEERAVYVRPLWYALDRTDRDGFRRWATDCHAAPRVIDAMTGLEIPAEAR